MVDQKSEAYRPRRAFIEPDDEPAQPERPVQPGRNGAGRPRPPVVDEDQPKPLYRDDVQPNGWSRPASRAAPMPAPDPPTEETLMTPATFAPRRPQPLADETTTILPRSRPTKHRTQALDAIDDYDDDERGTLGRRGKLALILGGVAAVVMIGLLIGYAVLGADNQPGSQSNSAPSAVSSGKGTSASQPSGQSGSALLTDAFTLSPGQAKPLDPGRTWKVKTTQHAPAEDAPTAACFGGEPLEGQPTPQQKILRVLTSTGSKSPSALHEATAYKSPEEASQAYAIASKTLGGCAVAGSYIESGYVVSGLGNQAAGVVVIDAKAGQAHSVVLNRTGRVMNVVDAAQPSDPIAVKAVAKALAQVNSAQCAAAGGECGGTVSVKPGPPPVGGDVPGFLATGDLPPARAKVDPWVATEPEMPKADFLGSQCETLNWAAVKAKSRSTRIYLPQQSANSLFGLNEIVLTTKDAKAASKVVDGIKSDLSNCKNHRLTATVTKPNKVTSIGAEKTKVAGWTAVVRQKSTKGVAKYRVGIVAAGSKVAYTFLNPDGNYDFTNHQWETVAVRAGERATQVR